MISKHPPLYLITIHLTRGGIYDIKGEEVGSPPKTRALPSLLTEGILQSSSGINDVINLCPRPAEQQAARASGIHPYWPERS